MTALAQEQSNSLLSMPEIAPDDADYGTVVMSALQAHFGQRRLLNYSSFERRDYTGDASHKVRVGGALVIECRLLDGDTFVRDTIEINDANRPFDEEIISALAAGAPVCVRDYTS